MGLLLLYLFHTETGKTVSRAISSLQEHGVKVEKIILVTLFATPPGKNSKVKLTSERYTRKRSNNQSYYFTIHIGLGATVLNNVLANFLFLGEI